MNPKQGKLSVSPARRAAFDILRRVEAEGAYASTLISTLPQSALSREDRALAQEIVLGVLRWQRSLDYFIERYSRRPLKRLDLSVLVSLRMGLYQIRHLSRIPQSAAVNESVNLVKIARAASAAGMVNAVLRNAARRLGEMAGEAAEAAERAAIEVSHPTWMLERWAAWAGETELRSLALANNEPPLAAFRVNTLRATTDEALAHFRAEGLNVRPSEYVPGAFVVEGGPASALTQAAERGLIYLQDEASQLVSLLLEPESGGRILDLCAAPGSKSSHIAALTENNAWVVACDIHPHRLATLGASCRRLGVASVDAVALDGAGEMPFVEGAKKFDRVLIDAPCSGTGTLRRNPEIKWRLSPDDIPRLADLQFSLLERGAGMLAGGGRLVYSTCSIEPEENEGVVRRFIESGKPFRTLQPRAHPALVTADGFVRTFPHKHGTDGFFAAVLERI
ncbi:MAG TPA: 16S rRNA (cytosine(967)-C(5))-methyltransferase RsmB [Blastocatellia bacterium]|jgi:16S rRNA (cytosine967-C5)-methyltransferase|nr:16S rRNA (cytosine(967)-C(5))-methyltransferase RsmB [Blastocatellia bacterium]